jgi:hypothetical protein
MALLSPKSHEDVAAPVEVLVNVVRSGEHPAVVLVVKLATGLGLTLTVFLMLSTHPAVLLLMSVTV